MPYTVNERYHAHVLHVEGNFLGSLERAALRQTVEDLVAAGHTKLVVDPSKTEFMDSTGVGLLINVAKTLRAAGGDARLAGLQDRVHGLFTITRLLGDVFVDYPTTEDALQSYEMSPVV